MLKDDLRIFTINFNLNGKEVKDKIPGTLTVNNEDVILRKVDLNIVDSDDPGNIKTYFLTQGKVNVFKWENHEIHFNFEGVLTDSFDANETQKCRVP